MGWWWRWFWYINPAAWMAYAVAANQMAGEQTREWRQRWSGGYNGGLAWFDNSQLPCPVLMALSPYALGPSAGPAAIVTTSGEVTTISDYLAATYGYHQNMAWPSIAILVGFLVVFRGISTWAVAKLNWSSR